MKWMGEWNLIIYYPTGPYPIEISAMSTLIYDAHTCIFNIQGLLILQAKSLTDHKRVYLHMKLLKVQYGVQQEGENLL